MKWAIVLLFFLPLSAWARPKGQFSETHYDFGVLPQGSTATYTYSLRNSGNEPLRIESVQSSCGCTAATPTNTLIPPGETAQIRVTFDSKGREGEIMKQIRVQTNDPKNPMNLLTIGGTVTPANVPEEAGRPHNEVNTYESK
ncbi:MAG: DUF1573 domain-containing protein [Elusimicrobia bacterium]|nr:DUF1573 domain-containing protein [Elusimicrobiota bacterium]